MKKARTIRREHSEIVRIPGYPYVYGRLIAIHHCARTRDATEDNLVRWVIEKLNYEEALKLSLPIGGRRIVKPKRSRR